MARNVDTYVEDAGAVEQAEQAEQFSIVFEDPPTVSRTHDRDGKWDGKLGPLRENPGRWGNLTPGEPVENPNATANYLKSGRAKGVSEAEFDFVSRTTGKTTSEKGKEVSLGHVYGIYLTPDQSAEKAEYDRISSERRLAIKAAKEALGKDASDEAKTGAVDGLKLTPLNKRSYLP